jgi:UDP-N-acetylglucosamine 2-epimerase (non-hydrolysing)
VANLRAEGYGQEQDVPRRQRHCGHPAGERWPGAARGALAGLGLRPGPYGLVTLHRPAGLDALLPALAEISRGCRWCCPPIPGRPTRWATPTGVRMIPPAGYLDFIALEASAQLVLTDSGGVQEETTVLGVPCLTLRDSTERPITLTEGTN